MPTAEEILRDYKFIYEEFGELNQQLIRENTDYGYSQMYEHFDSSGEARLRTKIASSDYTSYSIPEIIELNDYREPMREILEGCEQENGKVTKNIIRDDVNIPNNAQYTKRFGSLSLAKLQADLSQSTIIHLTDEQLESTSKEFLEYVDELLDDVSITVRLNKKAEDIANKNRRNGYSVNEEDIKDHYKLSTWSLPVFREMRNSWYSNGEKEFPSNLKATPNRARMWYACDGSLVQNEHCVIYSYNERDRPKFLKSLFNNTPFNPSFSLTGGGGLRFSRSESREFLNWLGEPALGYEYKWNINE